MKSVPKYNPILLPKKGIQLARSQHHWKQGSPPDRKNRGF